MMETIWKTVVGSHLYGLATEDSDVDYKGVFMPERENIYPTKHQVIGLQKFEPLEKYEFAEGDGNDKVEGMMYSAQYFLKLYMKGNPTLAELPFAGDDFLKVKTPLGVVFMQFIRSHLITKHLFGGYMGFFQDQVKAFKSGKGRSREKRLRKGAQLPDGYSIDAELRAAFESGDEPDKKLVEKLRHELISQGWYDGKMMSHAYRIGVQGVELFQTGKMTVTLEGEHLDIARRLKTLGDKHTSHPDRIPREQAIEMVMKLGEDLEDAKNTSPLPENPDEEAANVFLVEFLESYYGEYDGT